MMQGTSVVIKGVAPDLSESAGLFTGGQA